MYSICNGPEFDSEIPEWKKVLIMKKRAGFSPAEDNVVRNGLCENNKLKDPPKTVKIGSINVELRSVVEVPVEERLFDNSEDLRYGPGIVDRLRAKFLNIGVKQQVKPVVRRFSSLENLPGIPYRVNVRRQNGFKSVKKAQSMETLSCTTPVKHVFSLSRRPGAKTKTISKNSLDENDKSARQFNKRRAPNINEDELPKPDTVKHVKKIFESPLDSEKNTVVPRFRKIAANNSAIIGSEAKQTCAKDVNNTPPVEEINADNDLSVNRSCAIVQETSDLLDDSQLDSFKVTPERLPLELSHKQLNSLSQEDTCIPTEGMVVAGEDPQKRTWQKTPQCTTSIVFDFRGRKDVEPHISLNPTPFGCRPAKRTGSPPRVNGIESVSDDDDIGADLPVISGIVFAGENVKLARSSFLETRNKKLSIQFNDKATSTYEYPSESISPTDFDSYTALGSAANSRLGFSNYTPQVLSANDQFELGVSNLSHRPTVKTIENSEADVLIPADSDDTAGWSATETADILF